MQACNAITSGAKSSTAQHQDILAFTRDTSSVIDITEEIIGTAGSFNHEKNSSLFRNNDNRTQER